MAQNPTRRILVVDDEQSICSAIRRSLRRDGYQVEGSSDPTHVMAYLAENPVDAIISDHLMAGMTGLELLGLVRTRYPDCLRMMLTAHADMQTAIDAINHGEIFRFITKPWDDALLKATLHIGLERRDEERRNREMLRLVWRHAEHTRSLEEEFPGISRVNRDEEGAVILEGELLAAV